MSVLVIGGGYAGLKAALDCANDEEVFFVLRTPNIGSFFSKLHLVEGKHPFDILSPLIEQIKENEKIHVFTNSVIERMKEEDHGFRVSIRRNPLRIDETKCDLCGECWKMCPVTSPDRCNGWLSNRNAIYTPEDALSYAIERETPFCQATCPVSLDIRGYAGFIADGKFKEAYDLIREKVPFPGVLGRVCTHPCEDLCKRGLVDESISIAKLKRFVADHVYENYGEEIKPKYVPSTTGKKVAIIGAGPAGLSAAYDLKTFGYDVTVFEKLPVVGGMMAVGIPEYRLHRETLEREIEFVRGVGVEIVTGVEVDKDRFEELCRTYDATFISVGAHVSGKLGISGEDLEGVIPGIDFLRALNLGKEVKIGTSVVVVGGGNVAIDAARSVLRLGSKVFIVYRRSRAEMPASKEELESLEEEGIEIIFLANPTKILGSSRVEKLECIRMELGPLDDTGRRRPVPVEGTEFVMDVDTVIPAIGQASDLKFLEGSGVDTPGGRRISTSENGRTTVAGIFAGGDAATGAKTVIEAIAAGKRAALSINEYLSGEKRADFKVKSEIDLVEREAREKSNLSRNYFPIKDIVLQKRVKMPKLQAEVRITNFEEEELGYDAKMAVEEAKRCLSCRKCIGCGICAEVCPQDAIVYDQTEEKTELKVEKLIFAADMEENVPPGECMYSNVVTQIEFERMLSESGPYGGIIMRPFDGDIPREIAFIHVLDADEDECSPLAFEFLVQEAKSAKERDVDSCIFARELYGGTGDIKSIKIQNITVTEMEETKNLKLQYVVEGEKEEKEKEFDMVVLSVGFSLPEYVKKRGEFVGIKPEEMKSRMWGKPGKGLVEVEIVKTDKEGVFIAA
jgi:NADPH-dependent glutamate synthase beta subunit-like oxidoreductase/formate hydrogenlyase subunit 6/NADH:ubiquinone oxidoreductase subunit I